MPQQQVKKEKGAKPFRTGQKPQGRTTPARQLGDLRFRTLLGNQAWQTMPPAVQRRFSKRLSDGQKAIYSGRITKERMSALGWLIAQASRLIGAPLPLGGQTCRPATVSVTEDTRHEGQFWTRIYGRKRGFPQVIHSSKRFRGPTGLEEHIGFGFAMALTVRADGRGLQFTSDHYFLSILDWRVRLPRWMTPGKVTVSHFETGSGSFVFALELRHPVMGELLYQEGVFRDVVTEDIRGSCYE